MSIFVIGDVSCKPVKAQWFCICMLWTNDLPPVLSLAEMSFFTGGGPLSEPVRTVYRQIRKSLPSDPDIMEALEGMVNKPAVHPVNHESILEVLNRQADELRVAFNRKHFIECNMSMFDVAVLEEAAMRYEAAKSVLEIDPNPTRGVSRTLLMGILAALQLYLKGKRFFPVLLFSILPGKRGPNGDSLSHLSGLDPCCSLPTSCSGSALTSQRA